MKTTRYSMKFDYIEMVLLNLGKSIVEVEEELSLFEERNFEKTRPTLHVLKRINYLNYIIDCMNEIYSDVNNETKEMMKLLYMENNSFEETSIKTGIREKRLLFRHSLIVDEMMLFLGEISESESKKRVTTRRNIPTEVKHIVFERDNGKCTECYSKEDLHYHHIKRYANGGEDTVENLILLCVNCHAEEHKDEQSYYMLKSMAER